MASRFALAIASMLFGGCFVDGDGSGDPPGAEGTGVGTMTSSSSDVGPDEGPGSSDTSEDADDTSGGGSDDASSRGSSDDGDTTGESSAPCWDDPVDAWQLADFDASALQPGSLLGMALSQDGLDLLYTVDDAGQRRAFIASRETTAESFAGGMAFAQWANPGTNMLGGLRYAGSDVLVSTLQDGLAATSSFADGLWWPPEPVTYLTPPMVESGTPSLFDGGRGMMVDLRDGPIVDGSPVFLPYEARRIDADSDFGELERTLIPGWSLETPVLCVVASPDGEHIVFGGAFPAEWTDSKQVLASALDIWHAQREPDGTWGAPSEIDSISSADVEACPISITADGCAMTLRHFELGGGTNAHLLAVR